MTITGDRSASTIFLFVYFGQNVNVSEHFLTDHHTANDISLIPLELVQSNRDSVHKVREAYLITGGNTPQPLARFK